MEAEQPSIRIEAVEVDALVVMKIVKHATEQLPALANGHLCGLDFGTTLQITNCFPFQKSVGEDGEDKVNEYQLDMMRHLRKINVDHNTVGWYQSILNENIIPTQFDFQENIAKSVVLVYNPLRSSQGTLCLQAYRLSPAFLEVMRAARGGSITPEAMARAKLAVKDVFEEIPVRLMTGRGLTPALLMELQDDPSLDCEFDNLDLNPDAFLEKHLEFLTECVDELTVEQGRFQTYHRALNKYQSNVQNYLAKKRLEAKDAGEPFREEAVPLPFVKPTELPVLPTLSLHAQVQHHCEGVLQAASQHSSKLYMLAGLHMNLRPAIPAGSSASAPAESLPISPLPTKMGPLGDDEDDYEDNEVDGPAAALDGGPAAMESVLRAAAPSASPSSAS